MNARLLSLILLAAAAPCGCDRGDAPPAPAAAPSLPETPGPSGFGLPPASGDARLRRAEDLRRETRYAEAAAEYRRVLEEDGRHVGALAGLATVALNMGDAASAIPCASRAAELKPGDAGMHNLLGVALVSAGRRGDASKAFEKALEISPADPMILLNASLCWADLGMWARADDGARRAAEGLPGVPTPHILRGRFLVRQGRDAEAVPHFREAVRLAPDMGTAHYHLGKALLKAGRAEEGAEALRAALRTNPPPEIREEIRKLLAGR